LAAAMSRAEREGGAFNRFDVFRERF